MTSVAATDRIAYSRRARPTRYYKNAMRRLEAAHRVAALIRFPCSNARPETRKLAVNEPTGT